MSSRSQFFLDLQNVLFKLYGGQMSPALLMHPQKPITWWFCRRGMVMKRKGVKRQNNLFWYFPNPPRSTRISSKSSSSPGFASNLECSSNSRSSDLSIIVPRPRGKQQTDACNAEFAWIVCMWTVCSRQPHPFSTHVVLSR